MKKVLLVALVAGIAMTTLVFNGGGQAASFNTDKSYNTAELKPGG